MEDILNTHTQHICQFLLGKFYFVFFSSNAGRERGRIISVSLYKRWCALVFFPHPVILMVWVLALPSCLVNDMLMACSSHSSRPVSQLCDESISVQVAADDGCFQFYQLQEIVKLWRIYPFALNCDLILSLCLYDVDVQIYNFYSASCSTI